MDTSQILGLLDFPNCTKNLDLEIEFLKYL